MKAAALPDERCACTCCGAEAMTVFYQQSGVPTNSNILLWSHAEALACRRGDIALASCGRCGFIRNISFDERLLEYSDRYESTQAFSGTFDAFHRKLARELIERHGLAGKTVLEIGCGQGDFLRLLAEHGAGRCIGFDPAYRAEGAEPDPRVTIAPARFHAGTEVGPVDLVVCKMTLEHIAEPGAFLRMIREALGETDPLVFFQVPDAGRILREAAFEDVYYEHCSYFDAGSLRRAFIACGFEVTDLREAYGGQYLMIEGRPAVDRITTAHPTAEADDPALVRDFSERVRRKVRDWEHRLAAAVRSRTILWGSGSKAVAFVSALALDDQSVPFVVDVNPNRQWSFMPGSGQEIVSPEILTRFRPEIAVIMNPIYRDEIARDLFELGLAPELMTL